MTLHYHHGDLPCALRAAAVELIAEVGPAGFSLREVARRAGVSHAAPAHHFGDTEGLLTSVAAEGYNHITEQMAAAAAKTTNARGRLIACGTAYVETALANPGHYSIMVSHDYTDKTDSELLVACLGAYGQLLETMHAVRDEFNPDLDVDNTAALCWSTVHGLVELSPILEHVAEITGTSTTTISSLVEHLAATIIDGIRA